ncbi:MAG: hypothetical protein KDA64_17660 [Rhodospirillaceae bacterium]|nr:hypothetical protein [Rhodospirillaceae bacterium]
MSSSRPAAPGRRAVLGQLGGLAAALALAACGYQPLYGTTSSDGGTGTGTDVVAEMASISVDVIAERRGQILRRLLTERLTPRGRPADPRWRLETQLAETTERIGITETDVATRANLALTATYRLIDLADGSIAFQATTATVTSFNILRDEYATEVSRQSARDAALEQVAEDISRRLAIHFRSRPSP